MITGLGAHSMQPAGMPQAPRLDAKFLPAVKTLVSDAKKDDEHQVEEGVK